MNYLLSFLNKNNITYEENVSFKMLTTYKTGGIASLVVYPSNQDELILLIEFLNKRNIKYAIFGSGANTLASDLDYNGVIIKLDKLNEIKIDKDSVYVGAGVLLSKVAYKLASEGYKNYASFVGIPGTIGGAIYMNAGAFGVEIKDVLIEATIYKNKTVKTIKNQYLRFSKRFSILQKYENVIILGAKFKLEKSEENELLKIEEYSTKRYNTQPLDKPSCGSVFKNPINYAAGYLIDQCGLKGYQIGGAIVSRKHANFILKNDDNCKSVDILNLIEYVQMKVLNEYGIKLELEVRLFNF